MTLSIRHEWYQNATGRVTVDFFAKGIQPASVKVEATTASEVVVAFAFGAQRSADQSFERTLRLFGPIVPEAIAYNVTPFKMELSLVKANATSSWGALEAPPEEPLGGPRGPTDDGPMPYPSSARTKCNWDESSPHAREELQQAADGSESVDAFFKKLYGDADDDTRRAMMKSFVESSGTVLSTNWQEVGGGKVESVPPKGMYPERFDK